MALNQLVSEVSEQFASRAEQTNRLITLVVPGEWKATWGASKLKARGLVKAVRFL